MSRAPVDRAPPIQKAVVVHPDARGSDRDPDVRLEEAVGLALALDLDVKAAEVARLRKTVPATLFGRGKVSELMGDVAKGIKSFKKGMAEDDAPPAAQQPADPKVIDQTAQTANPQPAKAETKA